MIANKPLASNVNSNNTVEELSVVGTALGVAVLAEGSADLRVYCRLRPAAATQRH